MGVNTVRQERKSNATIMNTDKVLINNKPRFSSRWLREHLTVYDRETINHAEEIKQRLIEAAIRAPFPMAYIGGWAYDHPRYRVRIGRIRDVRKYFEFF